MVTLVRGLYECTWTTLFVTARIRSGRFSCLLWDRQRVSFRPCAKSEKNRTFQRSGHKSTRINSALYSYLRTYNTVCCVHSNRLIDFDTTKVDYRCGHRVNQKSVRPNHYNIRTSFWAHSLNGPHSGSDTWMCAPRGILLCVRRNGGKKLRFINS